MDKVLVYLAVFTLFASVSAQANAATESAAQPSANQTVKLYLFWREGCPHCSAEKEFLAKIQPKYPELEVVKYEVGENQLLFEEFAKRHNASAQYVPATFIGDTFIGGFDNEYRIGKQIESQIIREIDRVNNRTSCLPEDNTTCLPIFGCIDPATVSLPVFTVILGGLDSFNPCAFFILLFLLSLMVNAQSRAKMLVIGGIFVFFSGLIYFLFMAAWLNVFLVLGAVDGITLAAGIIAVAIGLLNVKEFFQVERGPSLTISAAAKPKLFERMRGLLKATDFGSLVFGTVVLAIAANTYELLCTAGFPLVYTRVLTLNNLTQTEYYLYLALYNVVYVAPLLTIVLIFTATLGRRKLTEYEGRLLKLVSGYMMLALGAILIAAPGLLSDLKAAAGIMGAAAAVTAVTAWLDKKTK
jgi:glutaredoxin